MIKEKTAHDAYLEFIHWRHHHKPGDTVEVKIYDDDHRKKFNRILKRMKQPVYQISTNPLIIQL